MKKFLKYIFISIIIVTFSLFIFTITNKYRINILKEGIDCKILAKGLKDAKAVTIDESGNKYIAYKTYIKVINEKGQEKILYKDENLNIEDIEYKEGNLYLISKDLLEKLSLKNKNIEILLKDIPSGKIKIDRKLLLKDNKLYITIPAKTNSGMEDGVMEDLAYYDRICNGTIYEFDILSNKASLYATGIRGVTGIDYNNEGKIIGIFTGMKNEGERPIENDRDYLYIVEKGQWYGFPDFSGGDYISSPRFNVEKLMEEIPQNFVLAPMYQYKNVDSLKELAIDREGTVLNTNSIIFCDKNTNIIKVLDKEGFTYNILKISRNNNIEDILYSKKEILLLDSSIGCLYSIHKKEGILGFTLPWGIKILILGFCFSLLMMIIYKITTSKKGK